MERPDIEKAKLTWSYASPSAKSIEGGIMGDLLGWIDHLERENKRLREALEAIIKNSPHHNRLINTIAREALKEGEDG